MPQSLRYGEFFSAGDEGGALLMRRQKVVRQMVRQMVSQMVRQTVSHLHANLPRVNRAVAVNAVAVRLARTSAKRAVEDVVVPCPIKAGRSLRLSVTRALLCCVNVEKNASLDPKRASRFAPKVRARETARVLKLLTLERVSGVNRGKATRARVNGLRITGKRVRAVCG